MSTLAAALPLFYRKVVPLSRERHHDWYIDTEHDFSFAAGSNSVYIAASEFAAAAREYAIVFARDADGRAVPAALLGLEREQNLLVGPDGRWRGRYVPAYVRRYPFILASAAETPEQFTVCIDEAHSGFNTAREGQRLIDESGEQGELLARSVGFLREFHRHTQLTEVFSRTLDADGLLDPFQAQVALNSGAKYSLSGLCCVTEEKLKALAPARLKALLDQGYLDLIYRHMHSLANIDGLMERVQSDPATSARQPA